MNRTHSDAKGFTLIELMVVISIIGLLSSVVLGSINSARAKARDARRLSDMHQVQLALELYRTTNGSYPVTGDSSSWRGACSSFGSWTAQSGSNAWIPNLAPTYIPAVPFDPKPGPGSHQCYLYISDGTDYMLLAHYTAESYTVSSNKWMRPLNPTTPEQLAFYTDGARMW